MTSRFGPDPHRFFADVYREQAPWDIGDAQPDLLRLLEEFPTVSPVLDVGCGSGDLAIAVARLGYDVTGIDFVETAIDQARAKVVTLPGSVAQRHEFHVADALTPSRFGRSFGAVVDSGFHHLFDLEERDAFASDLAACLVPGGRYYMLEFGVTFPAPNSPREVTEDELRARFATSKGWDVKVCRVAQFQSRIAPVPAIAACIERSARVGA